MRARAPFDLILFAVAVGAAYGGIAVGSPADGRSDVQAARQNVRVERDAETLITTIRIRSVDGQVAWSDVVVALARARGYDDAALAGALPDGRFELSAVSWRLLRTGLNLALAPSVHFGVQRSAEREGDAWLVIRLDRKALLASRRRFKELLRQAFAKPGLRDRRRLGIVLDEGWQRAPAQENHAEKDLVLLIHGLNSSPEEVAGLLAGARAGGLPCAVFRYPNGRPITETARLLASELKRFAAEHPRRGVSLLTHSMGGLIARAAVEDPALDPGNVRRLIMVAPPNHGSALARFAFALDVWEYLVNEARRREVGRFYALVEDGLSDAADDLRPGSPLLRALNARGRNSKVRYAIFLGSSALLDESDLAALREKIEEAGRRSRWVQFFGARAHAWLADLEEVVHGKGDGAVSIARGRLDGVNDTVVLAFSHIGVLDVPARGDVREVHQGILDRLRRGP